MRTTMILPVLNFKTNNFRQNVSDYNNQRPYVNKVNYKSSDNFTKVSFKGNQSLKQIQERIEYVKKLNNLHSQLKTNFCDYIFWEKREGNIRFPIPNCIMIEDPYDDVSKELIEYTRRNSDCKFIKLGSTNNDTLMNNLAETLNKSKILFDTTKERTLIHFEVFDRFITKCKKHPINIERLKYLLSQAANNFGSTVIFKTKDALKLASAGIPPQKIGVRLLVNFKSVE